MSVCVQRRRLSTNESSFERGHSTYSGAMHCCPQLSARPHTHCLAASDRSAVASTNTGFLPPSSSAHGVSVSAALRAMMDPTRVLPVKKTKSSFWRSKSVTTSAPSPGMPGPITDTTRGSTYRLNNSKSSAEDRGTSFDGLRITLFPAATAPATTPAVSANG
jgi:hypothetical protein